MEKKQEKIKVAIISGEHIENYFEVKKAVYLTESKSNKRDIIDLIKEVLEYGEDEKITIQIKEVKMSWFKKIKEID